jgi:hypothetical protein
MSETFIQFAIIYHFIGEPGNISLIAYRLFNFRELTLRDSILTVVIYLLLRQPELREDGHSSLVMELFTVRSSVASLRDCIAKACGSTI